MYLRQECDELLATKLKLESEVNNDGKLSPVENCSSSSLIEGPYSSVTSAYKAILADIVREKDDIKGQGAVCSEDIVRERLEQQVNRCKQLQSALALQRAAASRSLAEVREQHQEEVGQLEALVSTSQSLVSKQNRRFMAQVDKLVTAEAAMQKLLDDNTDLTKELRSIKNKLKPNLVKKIFI